MIPRKNNLHCVGNGNYNLCKNPCSKYLEIADLENHDCKNAAADLGIKALILELEAILEVDSLEL